MTSAPAVEPVTVFEAKEHLRVDGTVEDVLISSLIVTSRLHIEAALGLALISQSWKLVLDAWPKAGVLRMPLRPLSSVSAVRVFAADGTSQVVDPVRYFVDTVGEPPRVIGNAGGIPAPGRTANGIEVDFVAGYGAAVSDVPSPIRHAVLLLVAHWFEHRDPVEIGSANVAIPASVSHLLEPFQMARI